MFAEEHIDLLRVLWQNDPMDEASFLVFAKHRGIPVHGLFRGDPGDFYSRGWLHSDDGNHNGAPMFHPFRIYALHRILEKCRLPITASSTLHRDGYGAYTEAVLKRRIPSDERIANYASEWNRVVDLVVLLEPLFWPQIAGRERYKGPMSEKEYLDCRDEYHPLVMQIVETLDPEEWRKHHEHLRHDAYSLDENTDLYLLLRLSRWERRKALKGRIAGALWIRCIAEVLRRAFERSQSEEWPEEDQAFGEWVGDSRLVVYGSYRPTDFEVDSRPSIAFHYGLYTGSAVRWYVEGETEFYAAYQVFENPADHGIEIKNVRGVPGLAFQDDLENDLEVKRFSIVSFDTDNDDTLRAIRAQIKQGRIVGYIAPHKPDFEFSNFTIDELVEIAAKLDEEDGFSGDLLRKADWSSVSSMKEFEKKYNQISVKAVPFRKGKRWGSMLSRTALEHPILPGTDQKRLFIKTIHAAIRARVYDYDLEKQFFSFDPDTFRRIGRAEGNSSV